MKKQNMVIFCLAVLMPLMSAHAEETQPITLNGENAQQIYVEVVLIQASGNGGEQMDYPEEIEKVVEKMRSLFKFTKYSIIGRADAVGLKESMISFSSQSALSLGLKRTVPLPDRDVDSPPRRRPVPEPESANALFEVATHLSSSGDTIIFKNLTVTVHEPRPGTISASVNIRDGETLVLGASRGNVTDEALITVVTARLVK